MQEVRACLDLRARRPVSDATITPTSGLAVVISAILVCNHVSVYGIGQEQSARAKKTLQYHVRLR
eukprot:scaffold649841_cov38-Prasinocladus_malaysianus.AAC.1